MKLSHFTFAALAAVGLLAAGACRTSGPAQNPDAGAEDGGAAKSDAGGGGGGGGGVADAGCRCWDNYACFADGGCSVQCVSCTTGADCWEGRCLVPALSSGRCVIAPETCEPHSFISGSLVYVQDFSACGRGSGVIGCRWTIALHPASAELSLFFEAFTAYHLPPLVEDAGTWPMTPEVAAAWGLDGGVGEVCVGFVDEPFHGCATHASGVDLQFRLVDGGTTINGFSVYGGGTFPPWSLAEATVLTFESVKGRWPDGGAPRLEPLVFADGG